MRYLLVLVAFWVLSACTQQSPNAILQARVDSLENRLDNTYKPGFGEFMSAIQVHHAKLWFAGQAKNWELADFEINEIKESLDGIKNYCTDRPETKSISMLAPALDSIGYAIQQKDPQLFKNSYILLTNTCNKCHQATHHTFNKIVVPASPPFSNQDFNN